MAWWFWVLLGVVLLVIEISTPGGLFAIFFGIGAFLVALLALAGVGAAVQWVAFTAVSVVLLLTLRSLFQRKLAARGSGPVDTIVGEQAVLLEALPAGGEAKAELRGVPWTAKAVDGGPLAAGRRCRVERVEGLTLWLRAE